MNRKVVQGVLTTVIAAWIIWVSEMVVATRTDIALIKQRLGLNPRDITAVPTVPGTTLAEVPR